MTQITDKENKKVLPVAAAHRGAAGVAVSICQVEKDTTGRGRNETFQPLRCWKQQTVTKIKSQEQNKTKQNTHPTPPSQAKMY